MSEKESATPSAQNNGLRVQHIHSRTKPASQVTAKPAETRHRLRYTLLRQRGTAAPVRRKALALHKGGKLAVTLHLKPEHSVQRTARAVRLQAAPAAARRAHARPAVFHLDVPQFPRKALCCRAQGGRRLPRRRPRPCSPSPKRKSCRPPAPKRSSASAQAFTSFSISTGKPPIRPPSMCPMGFPFQSGYAQCTSICPFSSTMPGTVAPIPLRHRTSSPCPRRSLCSASQQASR